MNPRISPLAGTWYPGTAERLTREIRTRLDEAPPLGLKDIAAILVPHAGYAYSGSTAARAYRELSGHECERILVLGPSHRIAIRDAALVIGGDQFRTPLGTLSPDPAALDHLALAEGFRRPDPVDFDGEHSVEMQFPFLQTVLPDRPVTAIIVGRLTPGAASTLAAGLRPLLASTSLLVISSDFTHYGAAFGYIPFERDIEQRLRRLDLGAFEMIARKDAAGFRATREQTGATICGADAIGILLDLLKEHQAVRLLDYRTSGQITGDWSHCVSYLSAAVTGGWNGKEPPP